MYYWERTVLLYIQVKKEAFKINKKIKRNVGLTEH